MPETRFNFKSRWVENTQAEQLRRKKWEVYRKKFVRGKWDQVKGLINSEVKYKEEWVKK